jgi:hypothetical protein
MAYFICLSLILNSTASEVAINFTPNQLISLKNIINKKPAAIKDILELLKKFNSKKTNEFENFFKENPQYLNNRLPSVTLEEGTLAFISEGKKICLDLTNKEKMVLKSDGINLDLKYDVSLFEAKKIIDETYKAKKEFSFVKTLFIQDVHAMDILPNPMEGGGGYRTAEFGSLKTSAIITFVTFIIATIALATTAPEITLAVLLDAAGGGGVIAAVLGLGWHVAPVMADENQEKKCDTSVLFEGITQIGKLELDLLKSQSDSATFCDKYPHNEICVHANELKKCQADNKSSTNLTCQRLDELKRCIKNRNSKLGSMNNSKRDQFKPLNIDGQKFHENEVKTK